MENEPAPETLIASNKDGLNAGGVGSIRVWGGNAVRPGDQFYEVKDAGFVGDVLRIVLFLKLDEQERLVEVEKPVGSRVTAGALKIRDAARVTVFGNLIARPTDAKGPALYLGL